MKRGPRWWPLRRVAFQLWEGLTCYKWAHNSRLNMEANHPPPPKPRSEAQSLQLV